jgi:hypothetical protein
MARRLLAGIAVAATVGAAPAAADQLPILRSATVTHRHLVLGISVVDLRPAELLVSNGSAVDADGALLGKQVRVRETIQLPATANAVVRWQSARALGPGVYFVQVMAVETGGVTDCPRFLRNCLDHWSNVRRVVVGRSS